MSTTDRMSAFEPGLTYRYSGDVLINYEVTGSGRRTVVFLHGFAASIRNWDDVRASIPYTMNSVFLDLKGFGFSSKPTASDYTFNEQARIVRAFIEQHASGPVTLVGHSYGGGVALLTYLTLRSEGSNPIDSLLLIDSGGYSQQLPVFIKVLRLPLAKEFLKAFSPRQQVKQSLHRAFHNPSLVTRDLIARYEFFYKLPGALNSFVQAAKQAVPPDHDAIERQFSSINVPTLVIWGEQDSIIPFRYASRFAHDIATSRLAAVPSCGHVPQEEQPAATAALIATFLEQRE
jgi:pimeloyl-ACP methyl ester carboxylesterase